MNPFDLAVVAVIALSVVAGIWRGIVAELLSLAAWGSAIAAGWFWGEALGERVLATVFSDPRLRWLGGAVILALAVFLLSAILRALLGEVLKVTGLAAFDRFLGAWFGLARGVVVVVFVAQVLLWLGAEKTQWWQAAKTRPWVEAGLAEALLLLPDTVTQRVVQKGS
ncbi:colicin V biosynthesis protein [Hydrogenophilus thermoluteolus]|uniref:CvpA family protein n=1 Tax=Hydrogenophilus thermoluteolus TaxID=297 RepID=UPI0024A0985E|nr:CvpA family protein [Hydrogenophilus thermoluteolus]GLW59708.1 colicin V biosynthesis protein [Hydrogenophilus thermoluteolus]